MKPRDIKKIVEKVSGIEDLRIRNRERYVADCRFVYYRLSRSFCFASLSKISEPVGVTHATVLNGLTKFEWYYGTDNFYANEVYDKCFEIIMSKQKLTKKPDLKHLDPQNYYKILYIRHQEKTRSVINKLRYKLKNTRKELRLLQEK